MFEKISSINPNSSSTWRNKIFVTLDIDWAHDEVILDCLRLLEQADVSATFFVTHKTSVLERIKSNPKFEIGIHPNFNRLLNNDHNSETNSKDIIDKLMELVPEASALRCHSMTQSSVLLDQFKSVGLTHDVNHFIPHHAGLNLRPYELWNGLYRIPYFWEDDIQIIYQNRNMDKFGSLRDLPLTTNGLQVFDFHPIHIFLNTENIYRYEKTRTYHQQPEKLIEYKYSGFGTRSAFKMLLKEKNR